MALDFRDWMVAFMLLIIVLMVLDRMHHDSRFGGYGQSRKVRDAEYIRKHGFIGRKIVQMPRWEGKPPIPESMKRPLQKEEADDNQETPHNRNSSNLDQPVSGNQSGDPKRSSSGERRTSERWSLTDRSYMDRPDNWGE